MGKRSDFPRINKDFYRTIDPVAVEVLRPHLEGIKTFAEPFAGYRDLIFLLEANGLQCVFASDIVEQVGVVRFDARQLSARHVEEADAIITNCPWSRPLLHEFIEHLSTLKQTWLLFDADWAHTKQSIPFQDYCTDIVPVGRLQWIPDTTMKGKDNCAWYRFDKAARGTETIFHPPIDRKAA